MFGMLRSTLNNHVIPTLSMVEIESSCMKFWYVEVGRCAHWDLLVYVGMSNSFQNLKHGGIESSCMKFWYVEVGRCAHWDLLVYVGMSNSFQNVSLSVWLWYAAKPKNRYQMNFIFKMMCNFFMITDLVIARFMVRFRCHWNFGSPEKTLQSI